MAASLSVTEKNDRSRLQFIVLATTGGALKSGRFPLRVSAGATAHFKSKQKLEKDEAQTFIPFETMTGGGGRPANTPLSMHSEMLAIHSALSASSAVAYSAVSS